MNYVNQDKRVAAVRGDRQANRMHRREVVHFPADIDMAVCGGTSQDPIRRPRSDAPDSSTRFLPGNHIDKRCWVWALEGQLHIASCRFQLHAQLRCLPKLEGVCSILSGRATLNGKSRWQHERDRLARHLRAETIRQRQDTAALGQHVPIRIHKPEGHRASYRAPRPAVPCG